MSGRITRGSDAGSSGTSPDGVPIGEERALWLATSLNPPFHPAGRAKFKEKAFYVKVHDWIHIHGQPVTCACYPSCCLLLAC